MPNVWDKADAVGDKLSDVAESVGDKLGDVAESVGDRLGDVGEAGVDGFDFSCVDHCGLHACYTVAFEELRCGVLEQRGVYGQRALGCAAQRSQ